MRISRLSARGLKMACVAAALAAAGSAQALDKSGLIFIAADNTPAAPVNSAPGMPGRPDPDRGASADMSADMSADKAKQAVEDGAITTRIKTRLLTTKDLKSTGIRVKTKNGTVEVGGTVPSQQQRDLALDMIRSVEGVTSVNDNLKVSSR
ncbi:MULTISPECIES: BON domain-containing protein [unclassified Cupriavidus]|uniref:BON domain-containing protein n=1 Tax=unclassified Cupriavidus TaxID=2640874 RepID=UPI0003FD9529|nr:MULTISPECIES: BON domain-containing protein [unclassified Cupriavidus]MBP0628708.1 BON domain-containing protein [Cupriavidus sp. AcVe19-1a]